MADEDFDLKFKSGTEVLQGLFENGKSSLSEQFLRWKMWAKWDSIVGSTLSKQCEPVGFQRGVLIIWVPHSTVMQQMLFLKENILQAVSKNFPQVTIRDIRFTLDRKSVPEEAQSRHHAKKFVAKMER